MKINFLGDRIMGMVMQDWVGLTIGMIIPFMVHFIILLRIWQGHSLKISFALFCRFRVSIKIILTVLYPGVPILVITPLWAQADWIDWQGILDTAQFIIQNSEKYSQMQVSNRFKGIPPVQEYFIDGVHPNELGMELYTQNLVKEIDRIGF